MRSGLVPHPRLPNRGFGLGRRHGRAQPWRERLEPDRIDLGSGNRTLVPKGRLDATYRTTNPLGLDATG
jgi:hypothetical protein